MFQKIGFYVCIVCSLGFSSCKKEVVSGKQDYKILGSSANDFLSSSIYTSLLVEIDYMPGYALDTKSLDNLVTFLSSVINKPGSIRINQNQIAASGMTFLTLEDIVQIEKTNRTVFTAGNTIAVHILMADAIYSSGEILATSYWNTSTCLFGKTIYNNSGSAGQVTRTQLLTTLLKHEFGHLMGLVDQGSPMQTPHRDFTNGAHCINPECLMYYKIETTDAGIFNSPIPSLDANCMADLKANGGT